MDALKKLVLAIEPGAAFTDKTSTPKKIKAAADEAGHGGCHLTVPTTKSSNQSAGDNMRMGSLLTALDRAKTRVGIGTYGVTLTSLEEVFLSITHWSMLGDGGGNSPGDEEEEEMTDADYAVFTRTPDTPASTLKQMLLLAGKNRKLASRYQGPRPRAASSMVIISLTTPSHAYCHLKVVGVNLLFHCAPRHDGVALPDSHCDC